MTKRQKHMLRQVLEDIDLTKPTVRSLYNEGLIVATAREFREIKLLILNLINILLAEED